jgi:hypothetical protein
VSWLIAFVFMVIGCYLSFKIGYATGEQDGYEAGFSDRVAE